MEGLNNTLRSKRGLKIKRLLIFFRAYCVFCVIVPYLSLKFQVSLEKQAIFRYVSLSESAGFAVRVTTSSCSY